MDFLHTFEVWARSRLEHLPATQLTYELEYLPSIEEPMCVILDVFDSKKSGRITYRLDGTCDVEIINSDTEEHLLYRQIPNTFDKDFNLEFNDFFTVVSQRFPIRTP